MINGQNKKSYITVGAIIFIAVMGLVFVRTDYVSADRSVTDVQQTQTGLTQSNDAEFGESISVLPSLIRIFSALVLVVAAIYGGIYLLKKMMGRRYAGVQSRGNLEVLETIHIAPKKSITLLRVGEKSVLVGSTDASMSVLTELNDDETTKLTQSVEEIATEDKFANLFKSAVSKFKEISRKKSAAM